MIRGARQKNSHGYSLHPQDGSGITEARQILIASAAVEDSVPEGARARDLGCDRMSRAQLLSTFFNAADVSVAVGGTSGKSTVTGMIAWILHEAGYNPSVMNGAVMKNFVNADNPFASARVGDERLFVSEVDESDGSIALYRPSIGVLLNVSLDHKSIEELRQLFGNFLAASGCAIVNYDNEEARFLAERAEQKVSFGITHQAADITVEPDSIDQSALGIRAALIDNRRREVFPLILPMPGLHNLSNALAAIAALAGANLPRARCPQSRRSRLSALARPAPWPARQTQRSPLLKQGKAEQVAINQLLGNLTGCLSLPRAPLSSLSDLSRGAVAAAISLL